VLRCRPANSPKARFYRWASIALIASGAGCAPDAATTNRRAPGDRFDPSVVLAGARAGRAEDAMTVTTAGYQARPLLPAADGVRWDDVEMAVTNVSKRSFVGVAAYQRTADTVVGSTILADGQQGTVTVRRGAEGSITVGAQLGTFPDEARDRAFTDAVTKELRRLGSIKRPQPDVPPAS
jgi:hypothetical protein